MSVPTLKMNIPCASEFVGVVRLAVSGVASRMPFSIEEIEDIKISVSEACTNSVQHAYEDKPDNGASISVTCALHPEHLEIVVEDQGKGFNVEDVKTKGKPQIEEDKMGLGLGLTFIRSLMDEMELSSDPGQGTKIKMVKYTPKNQDTAEKTA